MGELAQVREQYRAGKTALFASLAASGASSRSIHVALQKLAKHTDATLQLLWQRLTFQLRPAWLPSVVLAGASCFPIQTSMCCCCCRKMPRSMTI